MIPREKLLYIPEPEFAHVWGPPLFVNLEGFIHHSQPTLFYRVGIDVLDVEDWHVPSDSSSSDGGSDSGDDGLPSGHGGFSQPWPKKTSFSIAEDVAGVNGSGDAPLGGSASVGFLVGDLPVPWSASPPAASSLGVVPQHEAHVGPRECVRVSASQKGRSPSCMSCKRAYRTWSSFKPLTRLARCRVLVA
jgi:hypothetical protein